MNRRFPLVLGVLFLIAAGPAFSQNWKIVWQDEFNGSIGPDWAFETGTGGDGWGNGEKEYYRKENATVENGSLVITAKKESFDGASYTSARLKTQGLKSWKYGRIEARIAFPSFAGSWPAFWMLGDSITSVSWPKCGELDIMEHASTNLTTSGAAHWWGTNNAGADFVGEIQPHPELKKYHVYAIEWTPDSIKWSCDGVLLKHNENGRLSKMELNIKGSPGGTDAFHGNFFIILNFAIGGMFPGNTISNAGFPAKMYVDYVRVYQDASMH